MTADASAILDREAFARLFEPLDGAALVLAAVSGGPDSTALMHALARWSADRGKPPLMVATVDHGLRPEAALEAAGVAAAAARLGLPHHLLAWTRPSRGAGGQAAAREARYGLLLDLGRRLGATHLATGHTLDDQAETVLIRLAAGSGPGGLAAMRPLAARGGLIVARPFLAVPKSRLVATCAAEGWAFLDDPSNHDPHYARARWRRLMPALAAEGLTAPRLARLAERAARVEAALEAEAAEALAAADPRREAEAFGFEAGPLAREPFEIALRLLALAVTEARGPESGPNLRLARLETLTEALRRAVAAGGGLRRSFGGLLVTLEEGRLLLRPEPPRQRGR